MNDRRAARLGRILANLAVGVLLLCSFVIGTAAASSPPPDRSTPRKTVAGFLRAVERGDAKAATAYLQLDGAARRRIKPADAAEQLARVLETRVWIQPLSVSDDMDGDPDDGIDTELIAQVEIGDDHDTIPITLVRLDGKEGRIWLFSSATLARLPELVQSLQSKSWVSKLVPERWHETRIVGLLSWQWFGLVLAIVVGLPLGYACGRVTTWLLGRLASRTRIEWDDELVRHTRAGVRFSFAWLAMGIIAATLELPLTIERWVEIATRTPLIFATGWLLRQAVFAITSVYLDHTTDDTEDRGLRTQIVILRRLSTVAIFLVTIGIVLMQFDIVRSVGVSLLASAGVAGVALGFGAQKSVGDLIAGLQLSMTQPIRLGDTVVLRGELGTVEEIKLTYVRIKVWDERRLVVPIEVFLSEVFENWSVPGDSLMGVVHLPVDPSAPVAKLRAEFERLAKDHPSHDGRECVVQVTDIDEHRAIVRAKISTDDPSKAWAMRCEIREAMVDFLQRLDGGRYLARRRWQDVPGGPTDAPDDDAPDHDGAATDG